MPSLTLAISAPVGRDTSDLAVTKKSQVFQISNRGRISGWQNGQIRSPYSRLIMGVSSFTKPRLPGLFSWDGAVRSSLPGRAGGPQEDRDSRNDYACGCGHRDSAAVPSCVSAY